MTAKAMRRWPAPLSDVPPEHPVGALLLAMAANVLGLGNHALLRNKINGKLQKLNRKKDTLSDSNVRASHLIQFDHHSGHHHCGLLKVRAHRLVVGPIIFATMCSTASALILDRILHTSIDGEIMLNILTQISRWAIQ